METLRLDGAAIRGVVQGRPVTCTVRSVPDGLVLPPGQYLVRVGEHNPIYGPFLSVESAGSGPGHVAVEFKLPASVRRDAATVATLVPAKPAYSAIIKEVPGGNSPQAIKFTPAAKFDAPAGKFVGAPPDEADFVPGQGMTARVIIAIRPIGRSSLVAQAGFNDLFDAVGRAGGVTLIVS